MGVAQITRVGGGGGGQGLHYGVINSQLFRQCILAHLQVYVYLIY
jgi:hypothetical protein